MPFKEKKEYFPCPRCNQGRGEEKPQILHEVVKPHIHYGKHYGYSIYCYNPDADKLERIPIGY